MIAPRKTLWSTPLSAVDHCMERIPLQSNDFVCDIGCGDGRIIHRWAVLLSESLVARGDPEMASSISFLGIEIDPARIVKARTTTAQLKSTGKILEGIHIDFLCKNALDAQADFEKATIVFLYLIPRGIKQLLPLIVGERETQEGPQKQEQQEQQNKSGKEQPPQRDLRIVSYMSKLPVLTLEGRALCTVEHQKGASWPLYFYRL